ncbi:MAG: hypothetical protein GC160_20550 [Acidobacteria bacterium]|nr:hypothetical protein [Acidobacteriota bacterium]
MRGAWIAWLALAACGSAPPAAERPGLELIGRLRDDGALARAHDVELLGDIAAVPGKGGSLALVDVSEPGRPRLAGSLSGLGDAETVLPIGDGLLLLGSRDLHVVDVSNPAAPAIVATVEDRPRVDRINGMARRGDSVFAACKSGYVAVFDIADPRRPRLAASVATLEKGGQRSPHDVAMLDEERIVVVDTARDTEAALRVYKVFDGDALLPPERWEAGGGLPAVGAGGAFDLGGANRVAAADGFAYVGAFVPDRVAIVDLRDPWQPRQTANMPVCDIDATGLTVAGKALFVAGGECVEAIDVSDPARPRSLAQYRGGELLATRALEADGEVRYDNAHDLAYRDGLLYVTAQNDNAFGVLRVNDERVRALAEGR